MSATVIICGGTVALRRRVLYCPVCEQRRRTVVHYSASPYYAPSLTCCGCGDSWSDGELAPRPFASGWRQAAIKKAKAQWAVARSGEVQRDSDFYVIPDPPSI